MACEMNRFDPSTYDAHTVHKPLDQLMREADEYRSRALAEMFAAARRALMRAFVGGRKDPWREEVEGDPGFAA